MSKRLYYALPKEKRALMPGEIDRVWTHYVAPYRVAPHVWNIGCNDDVAVYLLDTGEGLILIDTGMEQFMHYIIDAIWRLGHKPEDIKKILLTHWHGDHTNGIRLLTEMSGARVYMSREDEAEYQLHAEETFPWRTLPYKVDEFYDPEKPIKMGRFEIHTKLVPGHSRGATAFFFDDTDEETGKTYHVAMHGGLGASTMSPEMLAEDGLPQSLAHTFVKDCYELAKLPVDIMLASHLNQANVEPNIPEDRNDYTPFIDTECWGEILLDRAGLVKSFYPEVYGEQQGEYLCSTPWEAPEDEKKEK